MADRIALQTFSRVIGPLYLIFIVNDTLTHHLFSLNNVLDPNSIQLWRYEDPDLGPRKLPAFNKPTQGAVRIEDNAVFCVDVDKNKVELTVNGTRCLIGSQIIYIVQCE